MLRLPMAIGDCRPCDNTASAALMNGWISSIFISSSRARGAGHGCIVSKHVFDDFVEHFRLDRLLHKMTRSALQGGHDVFLIPHRGNHDHASLRVLLHNFFGGLNAFHLRHGDVHEHDIRPETLVFADGGQTVSGLARDLAAKAFDNAAQVLAREDGVVHDQILDRLTVLASLDCCKLLHTPSSICFSGILWNTEILNSIRPALITLRLRRSSPADIALATCWP